LLYSPFPNITARKALKARGRVIDAFRKYFETGAHLQAFPMIPEMYETNKKHGLVPDEAAKLEMATSLAMLSSGANTTFWLLCQIFSNPLALENIRGELFSISIDDPVGSDSIRRTVNLAQVKLQCPILMAMLHETFRYHSSVINIKQVQHDTTLAGQYRMKKDAIVMIPGQSVHHDKEIWGAHADVFNHLRFLSSDGKKHLASTSAFRPFGAGLTMCPGRHFSTNVILSLVSMVVLQYNIMPVDGHWKMPTKRNADIWNAMPKPDWDIDVVFSKRLEEKEIEWRFVWADENESG
jgi:cytochrome P450